MTGKYPGSQAGSHPPANRPANLSILRPANLCEPRANPVRTSANLSRRSRCEPPAPLCKEGRQVRTQPKPCQSRQQFTVNSTMPPRPTPNRHDTTHASQATRRLAVAFYGNWSLLGSASETGSRHGIGGIRPPAPSPSKRHGVENFRVQNAGKMPPGEKRGPVTP